MFEMEAGTQIHTKEISLSMLESHRKNHPGEKGYFPRLLFFVLVANIFFASGILFAESNLKQDLAGSPEAMFLQQGVQALKAGDFERALIVAQKSLSLDPKNRDGYYLWTLTEFMRGNNAGVITACQWAKSNGIESADLYRIAAQVFFKEKKDDLFFQTMIVMDDAWKKEHGKSS